MDDLIKKYSFNRGQIKDLDEIYDIQYFVYPYIEPVNNGEQGWDADVVEQYRFTKDVEIHVSVKAV